MNKGRKPKFLMSLIAAVAMLFSTVAMAQPAQVVQEVPAIAVAKVATPAVVAEPKAQAPEVQKVVNTATEKTISILATSDMHGRIYAYEYAVDEVDKDAGLAKIQTLVKQEKAKNPNSILIDVGDTVQDNSAELFNDLPVHPMIQALDSMEYDAWTLGNHEFNFGKDFLDRNIKAFEGKVLASNIYKEDGSRYVSPYTIIEKDGVRVAIIGIITPNIPLWEASTPDHYKGLVFNEVVAETQKAIKELEGKYDVLVGAFHLGFDGEYKGEGCEGIAKACPELDAIISGHAHSLYDNKEVNGVKIIEPGAYGKALATANITVKKEGANWKVENVALKNLLTDEVAEDQAILDEFKDIHTTSVKNANEVVGKVTEDFIKGVDYITGQEKVTTMPKAQIEDTALIDLINEVQLFYTGADVSAAAAFKNDMNLKAGDFKRKDVANIYKYTNTLEAINITGANLKKYMEWSASYYNTYKDGDVTISFNPEVRSYNYDMFAGANYSIDLSKEAGSRITDLTIKGKPVKDDAIYKLAINNYRFGTLTSLGLATQDDVYYDSYVELQDAGRIRDLIVKYVQEQKAGVISPVCDNNWKLIGAKLDNPLKDTVYGMIREGKLAIPTSEDGRTPNVKAINVNDLKTQGVLK